MATAPNALDQLSECRWRTVTFPTSSIEMDLSQDLAEHKYWGVDGARIEATGRNPHTITATIPFLNNIFKSTVETWGLLYPDTFRKFVTAMVDRRTGGFYHPEFGEIICKPKGAKITHAATTRDGVWVQATWIECRDELTDTEPLGEPSPVTQAISAANDLDAALRALKPPLPTKPAAAAVPNFAQTMSQIAAVGDQISLLSAQIGGAIAGIMYRVEQVEASALSAADALLWPIITSCERMRSALNGVQGKLLQQQRETRFYVVPRQTTLAALVIDIQGATISDLIKLNPQLVAQPAVPPLTVVRYYAPNLVSS